MFPAKLHHSYNHTLGKNMFVRALPELLFWCGYSIFGFSDVVFRIVLWCEYRMFCQALYCVVDGGYRIIS